MRRILRLTKTNHRPFNGRIGISYRFSDNPIAMLNNGDTLEITDRLTGQTHVYLVFENRLPVDRNLGTLVVDSVIPAWMKEMI